MEFVGFSVLILIMLLVMGALVYRLATTNDPIGDLVPIGECSRLWAAKQDGSCCTCGHEWQPGEIIGNVTQAYVLDDAGQVWHRPGVRQACASCVEWQRVQGDLSLRWVDVAHLDLS